jgi:valyl-tRNA synthetase
MPFVTEELWRGMGYAEANIEHRTADTRPSSPDTRPSSPDTRPSSPDTRPSTPDTRPSTPDPRHPTLATRPSSPAPHPSIITAPWPQPAASLWDAETVAYVEARHELIGLGRTLRADNGIAPGQKVDFVIKPAAAAVVPRLESDRAGIMTLLKGESLTIDAAFAPAQAMPSTITPLGTLYMALGAVDVAAEREKLTKQLAEVDRNLAGVQAKLGNENFVSRAPAAVIEQQRTLLATLTEKRAKLTHLLDLLKG